MYQRLMGSSRPGGLLNDIDLRQQCATIWLTKPNGIKEFVFEWEGGTSGKQIHWPERASGENQVKAAAAARVLATKIKTRWISGKSIKPKEHCDFHTSISDDDESGRAFIAVFDIVGRGNPNISTSSPMMCDRCRAADAAFRKYRCILMRCTAIWWKWQAAGILESVLDRLAVYGGKKQRRSSPRSNQL
jgi:hypothetical protein